jgi:hypothetical protein
MCGHTVGVMFFHLLPFRRGTSSNRDFGYVIITNVSHYPQLSFLAPGSHLPVHAPWPPHSSKTLIHFSPLLLHSMVRRMRELLLHSMVRRMRERGEWRAVGSAMGDEIGHPAEERHQRRRQHPHVAAGTEQVMLPASLLHLPSTDSRLRSGRELKDAPLGGSSPRTCHRGYNTAAVPPHA